MGCKCEDANGFQEKMSLAKKQTRLTGEIHVVYVHKAVNQTFMRKETELNNDLGICCYFLPDGTEVEWSDKVAKEIKAKVTKQAKADAKNAKKDTESIEVVAENEETIPDEE
jgi:hypothetical protein